MTKTIQKRCLSDFSEQTGAHGASGWYGIRRFKTPPFGIYPPRDRIQQLVTDDERAEAVAILKSFREAEQLFFQHDVPGRELQIRRLSTSHSDDAVMKIAQLRNEISKCNGELRTKAIETMRSLRVAAAKLAEPILQRAIDSLDAELNEYAIGRETALKQMGVPVFTDGLFEGEPCRIWHLHEDAICNMLHGRREVVRNRLNGFRHSADELGLDTIRFACTDEEFTFNW